MSARISILHFFDGFRTSHEITKVELVDDGVLRSLVDEARSLPTRPARSIPTGR